MNDNDARDIVILGKESCQHCRSAKEAIADVAERNSNIHWRFIDVDSDEGNKILDEEGYAKNAKMEIPIIKDCKTTKADDGTDKKSCRTIEGWSEKDFIDDMLDNLDLSLD